MEQGRALSLAEGTEALSSSYSLVARAAVQELGTCSQMCHLLCPCEHQQVISPTSVLLSWHLLC